MSPLHACTARRATGHAPNLSRIRDTGAMPRPVPAATAALRVLRFLSGQPVPVSATHIAGALGLPRSSAYHLLTAMADEDFVVHYPDDRTWGMGIAAWEVGHGFARQEPLARLARMPLARLVDRVGQSAHLVVLHGIRRPLRPRGTRAGPTAARHRCRRTPAGPPDCIGPRDPRLPPGRPGHRALSRQGRLHVPHRHGSAVADRAAPPAGHDATTGLCDRGRRGHRGVRVDRGADRRRHDPRLSRGHLGEPRAGRGPDRRRTRDSRRDRPPPPAYVTSGTSGSLGYSPVRT